MRHAPRERASPTSQACACAAHPPGPIVTADAVRMRHVACAAHPPGPITPASATCGAWNVVASSLAASLLRPYLAYSGRVVHAPAHGSIGPPIAGYAGWRLAHALGRRLVPSGSRGESTTRPPAHSCGPCRAQGLKRDGGWRMGYGDSPYSAFAHGRFAIRHPSRTEWPVGRIGSPMPIPIPVPQTRIAIPRPHPHPGPPSRSPIPIRRASPSQCIPPSDGRISKAASSCAARRAQERLCRCWGGLVPPPDVR